MILPKGLISDRTWTAEDIAVLDVFGTVPDGLLIPLCASAALDLGNTFFRFLVRCIPRRSLISK